MRRATDGKRRRVLAPSSEWQATRIRARGYNPGTFMSLPVGARLGPYEITSHIGAGGMGEVYRAHDARLGRDVAIKVLPGSLSADPASLARFEREARAIGALNHPNVVNVFDVGASPPPAPGGTAVSYVVMELLEGETRHPFRGRKHPGRGVWHR